MASLIEICSRDHNKQGVLFYSTTGIEVTCSCRSGFTGDGFTCEGNIIQVSKDLFLRELYRTFSLQVHVDGDCLGHSVYWNPRNSHNKRQ